MGDKYTVILEAMTGGVPVLTVNRRLARYLLARYERAMIEGGLQTWDTPEVMPFSSWIRSILQESWPDKPLLGETASFALWKKIISRDKFLPGTGILTPRGLAREAYNAYVLTRRCRLRLPSDDTYLTEESRTFRRWLGLYEKELGRMGALDYPSLFDQVGGLIESGGINLPAEVLLAGFDEITPSMASLLDTLRKAGSKAAFWPHEPGTLLAGEGSASGKEKPVLEVREYAEVVEEVRQCARWARLQAEEGKKTGIIVPELERYRDLIIREFSAELDPSSAALGFKAAEEVFNISLGGPLSGEPIVSSALEIISLNLGAAPLESMRSIVNSPYFLADEAEQMALARLDRGLREQRYLELSLFKLKKAAGRYEPALKGLQERLNFWIEALKEREGARLLPGEWAVFFDGLLSGLSWPSKNLTLNSREYQALTAWHGLLGGFAALDDVLGKLTWAGAAAELRAMASETIHQGETVKESPVGVLGLLEASGLEFDALWILGATETALPAEASPNPFIPLNLQKKARLPHSSPAVALAFAREAIARVLSCAPEVVASFPALVEGAERKVSPLLKDRGRYVKEPRPLAGHCLADSLQASVDLEDMPPDKGLPLSGAELTRQRGGTSILKDQSACPFRAFALHRLGARALSTPEAGLDNMDRGTVAHEAMRFFWEEVRDSEHLALAHKEGRLSLLIKEAAAKALAEFHRPGVSQKMLALEAERLQELLEDWMEQELKRGEFTVVELEKKQEVHVGGLTINARLDRVDRLNNGGEIIIDYKTGACKKDYWLPGRPKEPQMLLYALESGFNAIAFASLRLKSTGFVGVGRDDGMLPKIKGFSNDKWRLKIKGADNWEELNERWKETLGVLADDFLRGEARVDPNRELKENDFPCTFCELTTFCRVFEAADFNGKTENG